MIFSIFILGIIYRSEFYCVSYLYFDYCYFFLQTFRERYEY